MSGTHSAIMSHMAAYIHSRRRDLGMSLEDVAKLAGSTKAHIWALERGRSKNPTLGLILALCDALQCDMSTLMASPVSLATCQSALALVKSVDFIESLTIDPLLLPDDIEMTLSDVQRHARLELASVQNLMSRQQVPAHAHQNDREFDATRNVTDDEIRQWALNRADDAGYLARKLISIQSSERPEEERGSPSDRSAEAQVEGMRVAGWRPIETAPKDKDVLLAVTHVEDGEGWSHVTQGRWIDGEDDQVDQPGHDAGFVDCDYQCFFPGRSFGNEKSRYTGTQPTHWQPLPAPPARAALQSSETTGEK